MFKYDIDQTIFYMRDNKVHSSKVLSRMCVENKFATGATASQRELYQPFGAAQISYATSHGIVHECKAFASREELLESL